MAKAKEDKRPASAIPIEEKKTFLWIEHHRDLVAVAADMPHTRLIDVLAQERCHRRCRIEQPVTKAAASIRSEPRFSAKYRC